MERAKVFIYLGALIMFSIGWGFPGTGKTIPVLFAEEIVSDMDDGFDESDSFEASEDDFETDDGLDFNASGFDSIEIDMEEVAEANESDSSFWRVGGFFREELGYSPNHDTPDFTKIRSVLNLSLNLELGADWDAKVNWNGFYDNAYRQQGRNQFTDETLETYEEETELRDTYLEGPLTDQIRLKAGRQIIAWGQSDSAQITDVANPRDLREVGMVELEDARIPVGALKLAALFGSLELDLVSIHEFRPNKTPAKGSEFDFLAGLREAGLTIKNEEMPDFTPELIFRAFKTFNGGDISFIWGDTTDDNFYLDSDPGGMVLTPKYRRLKTVGVSGNRVVDTWLFKGELAKISGKAFTRSDAVSRLYAGKQIWIEKDLISGMIGFDYSGISDLTVTVEVLGEQIESYEETVADNELTGTLSVRLNHKALNETLETTVFWMHYDGANGDVVRLESEYEVMDALQISGGVVFYQADDPNAEVYSFRDNDRIMAGLKYSF
jgi:hypothetical protein